tara:strand:+ start:249 stop:572 length:324 start_codon:yes stop_codon:yes gene_type:complete
MSYLKIPLTPAVNGQTSVVIQKKDILSVLAVNATSTIINMNSSVAAEDVLTLTHTAAAAGYNVADILQEGWVSNPGGIVSTIGGVPATVSATGQALTFVVFSAALFT